MKDYGYRYQMLSFKPGTEFNMLKLGPSILRGPMISSSDYEAIIEGRRIFEDHPKNYKYKYYLNIIRPNGKKLIRLNEIVNYHETIPNSIH